MGVPLPKIGQINPTGQDVYTANGWVSITSAAAQTAATTNINNLLTSNASTASTASTPSSQLAQMAAIANTYTDTGHVADSTNLIAFFNNPAKAAAITSTINLYGGLPSNELIGQTGSNGLFGSHKLYGAVNYDTGSDSMHVYYYTAQLFDRFPDKGNTTDACSSIQSYITGLQAAQVAADTTYAADHNDSNHNAMTAAITNVLDYYQGLNGSLSCTLFLKNQADALQLKQEQQAAQSSAAIATGEQANSPTTYALYGLGGLALIVVVLVAIKTLKK